MKVEVINFKSRSRTFGPWLIQIIDKLRTQDNSGSENAFLGEKDSRIRREKRKLIFQGRNIVCQGKGGKQKLIRLYQNLKLLCKKGQNQQSEKATYEKGENIGKSYN